MAKSKRVTASELPPKVVEKIRADISEWEPGRWAERVAYGPACTCGLKPEHLDANAAVPTIRCAPIYECARHGDRDDATRKKGEGRPAAGG